MASIYKSIKTIKGGGSSFNSPKLRTLAGRGFDYKDSVILNSEAIGSLENELGWEQNNALLRYGADNVDTNDLYNFAAADVYSKKNIPFFDQDYPTKRDQLRKYSLQDEIEQILDILVDELIVYDTKKYFADIKWEEDLNIKKSERALIRETLASNFKKMYRMFGFKNENTAWHYGKKYSVDGYLSFEIIWDKSKKNIIGFKEIDPVSLTPKVFKDGTRGWVQYDNDPVKSRDLNDSQIIFISYSAINSEGRVSYCERLVRSFNLLRIMEQSRIIWSVVNSSYKTKFIIPVAGKSKNIAKQTVSNLMQAYRENINFDTDSGELEVNGKPMLPFNKEYWVPEGDSGTPQIETIGGEGPDLSDTTQLEYFRDKLISVSKLPKNRFMKDESPTFESSPEGYTREEIYFERFLSRIRAQFQEILVKPTLLQTKMDIEALRDDEKFDNDVYLEWAKYDVFEEIKEMEMFQKRIDVISSAKDSLIDYDEEGNEVRYFSNEFLVKKYLKMTEDEIKLNESLKKKEDDEINNSSGATGATGGETDADIDLGF